MVQDTLERVIDQMAPCGIVCASCNLGNGTVADTANDLQELLSFYSVREWASMLPGGSEVDFDELASTLEWIAENVDCVGCERGGGPPDCPIKVCAKNRGFELCSECPDLEYCEKFEWLGEYGEKLKTRLRRMGDRSKPVLIDQALDQMGI
jgi:hypothetical protein